MSHLVPFLLSKTNQSNKPKVTKTTWQGAKKWYSDLFKNNKLQSAQLILHKNPLVLVYAILWRMKLATVDWQRSEKLLNLNILKKKFSRDKAKKNWKWKMEFATCVRSMRISFNRDYHTKGQYKTCTNLTRSHKNKQCSRLDNKGKLDFFWTKFCICQLSIF